MITMTAAEQAVFEGADKRTFAHYIKVEIDDASGTAREWTSLGGRDFTGSLRLSKNVRDGFWQGELSFVWHRYNDNLSPFGLAAARYHDYANAWRDATISIKVMPVGADPADWSWHELADCKTNAYNLARNPGRLELVGRLLGTTRDTSFIDQLAEYGANDGSVDIEDAMQALVDDWWDPTAGTAPTIVVPSATSFQVKKWRQQKMPLLDALRAISSQIGWAIEERWQGSAYAIELYEPDRSASSPAFTFAPEQILEYGNFALDPAQIRNIVEVVYGESTTLDNLGLPQRSSVLRTATTSPAHTRLQDGATAVAASSIAKFGPRYMGLVEGASSLIQTQAQAESLADAAIADLSDPTLIASLSLPFVFWPAELNDYYRFTADGERAVDDLDLAVQGISIEISADGGGRTTLDLKGKPGLPKTVWLSQEGRPGSQFPSYTDAPAAPDVDVFFIHGYGTIVTLREHPGDWNYDQILWHRSLEPDFTPTRRTLFRASREITLPVMQESARTYYWKAQLRDAQGNITSQSNDVPTYLEPKTPDCDLIPAIGTFDDTLITGYQVPIRWGSVTTGSRYMSATRYIAEDAGAYTADIVATADADPPSDSRLVLWNRTANLEAARGPLVTGATTIEAADPVVEERTVSLDNAFNTNVNCDMPATVNAGDLLLTFIITSRGALTQPTGWTEIAAWDQGSFHWGTVAARKADGTEGGTTVTWVAPGDTYRVSHVIRVRAGTWLDSGTITDDVKVSTKVAGIGTSQDPGSVTAPSSGQSDNLFITFLMQEGGSGVDVTGTPTGYTNMGHDANNDGMTATAWLLDPGASDDPDAWTSDTSDDYVTGTVAISGTQEGVGAAKDFTLRATFVVNEADELELRVIGSEEWSSFSLDDGTWSIVPVPGTCNKVSRDNPDPSKSQAQLGWLPGQRTLAGRGTLEILDAEPRGRTVLTASQQFKGRAIASGSSSFPDASNGTASSGTGGVTLSPPSRVAGDLLIAAVFWTNTNFTPPSDINGELQVGSGWQLRGGVSTDGPSYLRVYSRIADGSTNDYFFVSGTGQGDGNTSAYVGTMIRATDWGEDEAAVWDDARFTASDDPPSATESEGAGNNTFVAIAATANDFSSTPSAPTNYTMIASVDTNQAYGDGGIAAAYREYSSAATDDPGAFGGLDTTPLPGQINDAPQASCTIVLPPGVSVTAADGEVQAWAITALAQGDNQTFGAVTSGEIEDIDRSDENDGSAFTACCWNPTNGQIFAAGHTRNDGGTDYAFLRQWSADGQTTVLDVVLSTLGTDEEIPTGVRVRSFDQSAWVATKRDSGTGRIFRAEMGSGGAGISSPGETSSAIDDLLDLVLLESDSVASRVIAPAAGDLYCYDADDLTDELWTVDITTLYGETFRADAGAELRESADGKAFYMAPGGGWSAADGCSTLYKFSRDGALLWSRDVSAQTTLDNVDGVGPIAVADNSGDVVIAVVDYNAGRPLWDLLTYDRNGAFRGSFRKTYNLDPQAEWDAQCVADGKFEALYPPTRLHRYGATLTAFFRSGGAMTYRAVPATTPAGARGTTIHELDFAGMADGETQEFLTLQEVSPSPGDDIVLRQATAGSRGTFRAAAGTLQLPAIELDGTDDFYESIEDLAGFALDSLDGVAIFVLAEGHQGSIGGPWPVITLWSQSIGENKALVKVGGTEAVSLPSKYGGGGSNDVFLMLGRNAGVPASNWFDLDNIEATDLPMLTGIAGGREVVDNNVMGQGHLGGTTKISQEVYYKEALADSWQSVDVAGTKDPATHFYRCDAASPTDVGDGTAQDGTAVGTPTVLAEQLVTGSFASLDFDSGEGFTLPDHADFDVGDDATRTWEFWVQPSTTWTGDILIAQKTDGTDGWVLYWDHSELQFRLELSWASGASAIAAVGPVQAGAPSTSSPTHVAFTTAAQHSQVWQDGVPGTETTADFGDCSATATVRVADADANTPAGVSTFVGKMTQVGMWTARQHPWSIWYRHRVGRWGHSPALRHPLDSGNLTDHKLTIGRRQQAGSSDFYFDGYIHKIWIANIHGAANALPERLHALMRDYLPTRLDLGTPARTKKNDPRFYTCALAWVWCRFWAASGSFSSDTEDYGPHYAERDGTAANVGAYQQAPPDIRGLGSGPGGGNADEYSSGYAVTLTDTSTITFDLPSVGIHLLTSWSVSWAHKWDTLSVHTRGHVWSIDLTAGFIRVSIAADQIRVEWNDGTITITSDFACESNPLDGNWHACEVRFSSGLAGALMDISVRHSGGTWYPLLPVDEDALDPADYGDMSAAEIVFGAGSNVPAGEEFEGDLAQLRIAFGDLSTTPAW